MQRRNAKQAKQALAKQALVATSVETVTGSQSQMQHPHPCVFHMLCALPAVFDTNNDGMKGNSRLLCVSGDTSQTETLAKRKPFAVPIPTARYGGIAAAQKNLNLCLEDLDGEALKEARSGPAVVGAQAAALRGFLSLATPRNVHAAFIPHLRATFILATLHQVGRGVAAAETYSRKRKRLTFVVDGSDTDGSSSDSDSDSESGIHALRATSLILMRFYNRRSEDSSVSICL